MITNTIQIQHPIFKIGGGGRATLREVIAKPIKKIRAGSGAESTFSKWNYPNLYSKGYYND